MAKDPVCGRRQPGLAHSPSHSGVETNSIWEGFSGRDFDLQRQIAPFGMSVVSVGKLTQLITGLNHDFDHEFGFARPVAIL